MRATNYFAAVDSHTEGMPTRVITGGLGPIPGSSMQERRLYFEKHLDDLRLLLMREPRGHSAMSGAFLQPPTRPDADWGVLFVEVSGLLPMCGHGTIGLVTSLAHVGRLSVGQHAVETPVGTVQTELHSDGTVSVDNVECRCHAMDVELLLPGYGSVVGDVAWGGNWFFLIEGGPCELSRGNIPKLMDFTERVKNALTKAGVTGAGGEAIDHVEVSGPPVGPAADSRNFVLCPGGMYDRSPCGTGTSAKLASLYARGRLKPGQVWRQEGILGGVFEGVLVPRGDRFIPRITGRAYVTGEAELVLDDRDPFCYGFPT